MALTASIHYVIPSLIGRGMPEHDARDALKQARIKGRHTATVGGTGVILVSYSHGKYTVDV